MSVKERLKTYTKYIKITISDFEKSLGVANGYVNSISKSVGLDKVELILEKYPNLSIEWLLTGQGSMIRPDREVAEGKRSMMSMPKEDQERIATATPSGGGIPLIPLDAMAGFGTGEMQVLEQECERYIVPMFREAQFLIPVKGASMQPKYNSGDLVACKKLVLTDIFFQWNKVYVLDTAQGALIKRICKGSDTEHIKLVSENEKYDPFELHLSQVNSVALVIGVIRLE